MVEPSHKRSSSSTGTDERLQADKLRTQQQLEALQNRYIGTGHADMTRDEWTDNIARDSYSSFVGHPSLLYYMSVGMNQPMEITRTRCIRKMISPGQPLNDDDYYYPGRQEWQPYDATNDVPGTMEVNGKSAKPQEETPAKPQEEAPAKPQEESQAKPQEEIQAQAQNGDAEKAV
nr:uncharacterized protein LOC112022836 [Quercus suber]